MRRLPLIVEDEQTLEADGELDLPPQASATGFEYTSRSEIIRKNISDMAIPTNNQGKGQNKFQDRLLSIYKMNDEVLKEKEYIRIAREWNSSTAIKKELAIKNELVEEVRDSYRQGQVVEEQGGKRVDTKLQMEVDDFHTRWLNICNIKNTRVKKSA